MLTLTLTPGPLSDGPRPATTVTHKNAPATVAGAFLARGESRARSSGLGLRLSCYPAGDFAVSRDHHHGSFPRVATELCAPCVPCTV